MEEDIASRVRSLEAGQLKIRGLLGEVASALWGDMVKRDNGLRSRVRELEEWQEQLRKWQSDADKKYNHYLDHERRETCHGLKALAQWEACEDEENEEGVQMKIATINASTMEKNSRRQFIAQITVQILVLLGVLASLYIKVNPAQ